jgi:hypothetical protein
MHPILARTISIFTHPLLILSYILIILLAANPYQFGFSSIGDQAARLLLLRIFLSSFFLPGMAVLMLRFTGLVKSMDMPEKTDRIGPYIVAGIFYLWLFRNLLDNSNIPRLFTSFTLGATLALFLAFFINLFSKISIHAVGMGGLIGMILLAMWQMSGYPTVQFPFWSLGTLQIDWLLLLLIALLLAGITGTARLALSAHEPLDLYGGYIVGFMAQIIAMRFILGT